MNTEETLRAEVDARRAVARAASRRFDAIVRYFAAFDYADRRSKEGEDEDETRRERRES